MGTSGAYSFILRIGRFFFLSFVALYWMTELPFLNRAVLGVRMPLSAGLLMLAVFCAVLNLRRLPQIFSAIPCYCMTAFIFITFISVSTISNEKGIKGVIEFSLYLSIPVVTFLLAHDISTFFRQFLYAYLINGFTMAVIGLYRLFSGKAHWVELIHHEKFGYGSRNLDAFFVMMGYLACLLLIANGKKRMTKIILCMLSAVCFAAIVLSLSRGMLLTAMICTAVLFMSSMRLKSYLFFTGLAVSFIALLSLTFSDAGMNAAGNAMKRFSMLSDTEVSKTEDGLSNSVPGRLMLIPLSFKGISQHPLTGLGLNGFPEYAKKNNVHVNDPHNNFLLVWVELGTFAFIAYFCIAMIPIYVSFKLKKIKKYDRAKTADAFMLFAFVLTFTSLFTNYVTYFGYWIIYSTFFLIHPVLFIEKSNRRAGIYSPAGTSGMIAEQCCY